MAPMTGANRGRTVERRGVVLRMVRAPDVLPVRCDPIHLRIFDVFVTTKPQGTGIGLPIARTIVESYGGDISAENRLCSAIFSFRLPLNVTSEEYTRERPSIAKTHLGDRGS